MPSVVRKKPKPFSVSVLVVRVKHVSATKQQALHLVDIRQKKRVSAISKGSPRHVSNARLTCMCEWLAGCVSEQHKAGLLLSYIAHFTFA